MPQPDLIYAQFTQALKAKICSFITELEKAVKKLIGRQHVNASWEGLWGIRRTQGRSEIIEDMWVAKDS